MTKAWTVVLTRAYSEQYARVWVGHPELRPAIDEFEKVWRNHLPELDLFIERTADRLRSNLWVLPHPGIEILLKLVSGDRIVSLEWIRPA